MAIYFFTRRFFIIKLHETHYLFDFKALSFKKRSDEINSNVSNGVFVNNNQDIFIYIAIIRSVCYTPKDEIK